MKATLAQAFASRSGGYWGAEAGAADLDARAIRNGDVGTSGDVRWDALPIRSYTSREFEKARVHVGDVVLTTSGNCGNVAHIRTEPELPTVATNFVRLLRVDERTIDSRYIFHFMRTAAFKAGIAPHVRGATIKNLSVEGAFASIELPLPPLPEQRRIAAILDHAEALRAKRRQALAYLNALPQASFHEMFGEPSKNPKQLPLRKLAELGRLDRGVSKHRPRNDPALLGGPFPLIQTGDVARSDGYIREYSSTYSALGLAQSKVWPAGTLCVTIAANIGKTGILTFDACFPDSVVGFTSDPETVEYVRVWLSLRQAALEASAPQSAQKNINLAILRALDVPLPDRASLIDFSNRVSKVRELAETHRRAASKDGELFASLQSRAFDGRL